MKNTVATISVLNKDKKQWLFLVNMKLSEDDRDLPSGCYRDLGRALNTFLLHADLENPNVFEENNLTLGPYVYHDNEEIVGLIVFSVKDDIPVDDSQSFASKILGGVNAAAGIIRYGGGRIVRRRIKPIRQLLLPAIDEA